MKIDIPENLIERLRNVARNKPLKQYITLLHDALTRNTSIDPNNIEISYKANLEASKLVKEHLIDFFDRLTSNEYETSEEDTFE